MAPLWFLRNIQYRQDDSQSDNEENRDGNHTCPHVAGDGFYQTETEGAAGDSQFFHDVEKAEERSMIGGFRQHFGIS